MKERFLLALLLLLPAFGSVNAQTPLQPYRLRDGEVAAIIQSVEKQADTFRHSLRTALNKSHFDGTRREDDINAFVREFDRETSQLRDHFNHRRSTSADVQSVLTRAAEIDRFITRNKLTAQAHNDWNNLRSNLEQLAEVYSVSWRWDIPNAVGVPIAGVPFRLDDKEVERILHNLERQSDRFSDDLRRALDRSPLDGTRREDNVNEFVKDFYSQTKLLRDRFNDHKSTGADLQTVLERAGRIDQFLQRRPLNVATQNDWAAVRTSLDDLARAYNVRWGWTGIVIPQADEGVPVIAEITESGTTKTPGYRISLAQGGRAEISTRQGLLTGYVPAELAQRFFTDLAAAMPLAQLSSAHPCLKSSSFGGSVRIDFANQQSPDLSCASGARAQVLNEDINAIKRVLSLR